MLSRSLFKEPVFRGTLLGIILLELISFFAWLIPSFGNIAFVVIALIMLIISMQDLRIGLGIVLAELVIGSHGYLFSLAPDQIGLAIRHALFLVVMIVGLVQMIRDRSVAFFSSIYFWPSIALLVVVSFSILRGVFAGNELSTVFFDTNAFIFFGLALPIWQVIKERNDLEILIYASLAALTASTIKVFFLLYVFTHKFWWMLDETYRWVRDTRIGEITQVTEQFFRIFFQSQIFTIIAFFLVTLWLTHLIRSSKLKEIIKTKRFWVIFLFLSSLLASILISFSRSNWVGMFAAGILVPIVLFLSTQDWLKRFTTFVGVSLGSLLFGLIIVSSIVLFPYPKPSGSFDATNLLSKRAFTFTGEAGVSSRWQLLDPLWSAVQEHVILGSGFGTAVTYITQDPRILAQSPTGEYTTIAFEWGYLDLWLKMGLIGLLVYAALALFIVYRSIQLMRRHKGEESFAMDVVLIQGLFLGGVALFATHTFSPYLNHPLGIGYLLFWAVTLEILEKRAIETTNIRQDIEVLLD